MKNIIQIILILICPIFLFGQNTIVSPGTATQTPNTATVSGGEPQTLSNSSSATEHTVILSDGGGGITLQKGAGIELQSSGSALNGSLQISSADTSATNELDTLITPDGVQYVNGDTINLPTDFWFTPPNDITPFAASVPVAVYFNTSGQVLPASAATGTKATYILAEIDGARGRFISNGKLADTSIDGVRWLGTGGILTTTEPTSNRQYLGEYADDVFYVNIQGEFSQAVSSDMIVDADGDTYVRVDSAGTDPDRIDFRTDGNDATTISSTQVQINASGTNPIVIEPTGGFHANAVIRTPNGGGNASWIFENSGDGDESWFMGRIGDGTFELSNSVSQPYSATETRYFVADPSTKTLRFGESADTLAVLTEGFDVVASQTITTTASTGILRSRVFYNVTAGGTATADVSLLPDDTDIVFWNIDDTSLTISLSGATWVTGSDPVLTENQSVSAHLLGGVLYPY